MMMRIRISYCVAAAMLASPAIAQTPGLAGAGVVQPQDRPGYCLTDWRGEHNCYEGSREAWPAPRSLTAFAQILAPAGADGASDRGASAPPSDPPSASHVCGAVLVAPDWALTAGRCVDGVAMSDGYRVAIGYVDARTGAQTGVGARLPIAEIVLHPDYKQGKADLALVRFSEDKRVYIANPTYSPWIDLANDSTKTYQLSYPRPRGATYPPRGARKVRFADINTNQQPPEFTPNAIFYRWSLKPDGGAYLSAAPLFQVTAEICNDQRNADPVVEEQTFCALSRERPVCPADAGSPVIGGVVGGSYNSYVDNDEAMHRDLLVVAIATPRGKTCDAPGAPGRFTLVRTHQTWIRNVVRDSYDRRKAASMRILDPGKWEGPER